MANPIINNRIVCDKTFAIRLYRFISAVQVSDMAGEEEQDYLLAVAEQLVEWQIFTATTDTEIKYLQMNSNYR